MSVPAVAHPIEEPDFRALFESAPGLYLVLTPRLTIVAVSDAYLRATMTRREDVLGRGLFDVFPDNPDDPAATGTANLRASLERVLARRAPDTMAVQKYDIRRPAAEGGSFEVRYWSPVNSPVLGRDGQVRYIIHRVEDVTERVRLEQQGAAEHERAEELRAYAARIGSLLDQAHDAILVLDATGTVVEVNRETERLLARRREEILGRGYEELVAPEEREGAARRKARLLSDGVMRLEARHLVRPDGTRVAVEVSGSLVRLEEQSASLLIVRDVTERWRAEEALRRSEEALRHTQQRLQHILSSSPAVLYSLRVEGTVLVPAWVSANIERLTGYTPEEVVSPQWWSDRLHPDDRETVLAQASALMQQGSVVREYRFRHKDGLYRWVHDEQLLVGDAAGRPEVVGSWSEITARKDAERRLEESEAQYRLLFESNPYPMWVFDAETLAFLAVNDAAVRHYGWTREEFLGLTLADVRPPHTVPELMAHVERVRRGDPAADSPGVFRHRRKDGTEFDVEIAARSILFRGRPARLSLVADVTEKKMLEAQLVKAQKMEAVGQLAGGVAHDFNNLLGVISGYSDLLIRELPPSSRERLRGEEIRAAADRAAALTRQLLAFSRRQLLQPRVLDLNDVIAGVERMLRRLISEDVQIVTVSGTGLGRVRADAGQIEQVVMNLAINARDAMPGGGGRVIETGNAILDESYARLHPEAAPGPYVMLAVSDSGHGMDAATMSRIFEPFFTTKGEGKGTGLGLATVYGIVRQSGGTVNVYSEPGRGTSFKVYLPRIEDEVTAETAAPPPPPVGGSETVLVVEDADALRLLIRELLESAGYGVLDAATPEQALEIARSEARPIDLLLTDVVMPRMNGRELAAQMAALKPSLRAVFMSGYTDPSLGEGGVLPAGTAYLQKPFTMDALLRTVRDALGAVEVSAPPAP